MSSRNSTSRSPEQLFANAVSLLQGGRLSQAEQEFRRLLERSPDHPGALNLLGVLLTQLGRLDEAEPVLREATRVTPTSDATLYNHGVALQRLGRLPEALDAFSRALALNATVAETWNNRGTVLNALRRHDEAIGDFDKALALKPGYAEALCNRGNPLIQTRRYAEALATFEAALKLNPAFPEAWQGRGDALAAVGCHEDAIVAFAKATALKPDYAEAHSNAAASLARLGRADDALAAFETALKLRPDLAQAWRGRGTLLAGLRRYEDAIAAFETALALDPEIKFVPGDMLHAKAHICDWRGTAAGWSKVIAALRNEAPVCPPFALLASPASAADQRLCSAIYAADSIAPAQSPSWHGGHAPHARLRIGYLSGDYREHPTAHLMAGLFEQHDRARFETIALSYGIDDGSAMRARLSRAFDRFVEVRHKSDPQIARLIREMEIDIAVDLAGFTEGMRLNVLAQRPAPLQVSYLVYPGTLGTTFIDYIVADRIVIPEEHQRFYAERIAYLPGSYQVRDASAGIADATPTRAEAGLPERGFVFCSFNNSFKITPEIFDVWMRLLHAVEDSVLWLLEANASAVRNLRAEARARGVAPDRLVFAPRAGLAAHLARHRLADLFLDTIYYGAHTTASDALWGGLPVLTCLGSTFAGRVAASLLHAVGLPELITPTLAEYEAAAIGLARDPERLGAVRTRLAAQRLTAPLFNTELSTRHLEAAYRMMWERHQRGEPPQTFDVVASG
ncbi:MAG TPA: tetratricopeptide repeat protein [Xanthobacteraceae bacterium]|nr:tetratricopeptide repeat protein [Xanthobacteraceae bacterium]